MLTFLGRLAVGSNVQEINPGPCQQLYSLHQRGHFLLYNGHKAIHFCICEHLQCCKTVHPIKTNNMLILYYCKKF